MAHLYLSAAQKSSGKTTLSIGLAREISGRGRAVQPFKKGPDYIDPLWLARAAGGRACYNLDFHTMSEVEIQASFSRLLRPVGAGPGPVSVERFGLIEGNVGLFDSIDLAGAGSNAALAKLLRAPVVLVLDTQGMGRGIAPLLLGYQAFDPDLWLAGIILNKVGGARHETNLRRVVEYYTDLPVLGAMPRSPDLTIEERHLGLIPSNEAEAVETTIEAIRRAVAASVDVEGVLEIAEQAPTPGPAADPTLAQNGASPSPDLSLASCLDPRQYPGQHPGQNPRQHPGLAPNREQRSAGSLVRIGIAQDEVFGFYYPDDLAALRLAGAELVPFSPLSDSALPEVEGLILGGGFPESRMAELEANRSMRESIAAFIHDGGVAYAECGGLMYLCERLHWNGQVREMCGVLKADVAMHERPQGRGYVRLRETEAFPWPRADADAREVCAHEFHHSAIVAPRADWRFAYQVMRGAGIDGRHDGIIHQNLLASYAHLRSVGSVNWTRRFVDQVRALC
jgi:cobyrinic acid a,c-diamide synthase